MELYIPPKRTFKNLITGQFLNGHIPFNKGKKWSDYLDMRKARKIKKNLELGRKQSNPSIAGWNRKKVIGIKDHKIIGVFDSSNDAGRKLGIQARNIRSCCAGKRKTCGGVLWYWERNYDFWINQLDENGI